ncbi:8-amino-7-oxononanoate synthase [Effusibacillus dendaii]|uniref:8-amino-7-ketopelargonate synthase n=1 Tax=Effusibacillus dendaii TaxID=2743772 RepID=A0A7I8D9Z5_9BACL|nr:8-amino-7-oxononanoate synthase [Effusibacillus dendaii]BCJ86993.1 8-amino-7-oxononanoate synthase 2 [Effusibacillus dendaii]
METIQAERYAEQLSAELNEIQRKGLYRQLRRMDSASSRTVTVEGKPLLMFASNNYLGLSDDPRMIEASVIALRTFGTGSSGSRLTTGNFILHEQLEKQIAGFKNQQAAIVFNTGYMANLAALTALAGESDIIFSDEWNHASIIDGCRLSRAQTVVYRHADMADLQSKLANSSRYRRRLIVTDGVFSMDGDIAPLPEIVRLAEQFDAWVMVDDAHATGVLGERGSGTADYFGLSKQVMIQMGTLSKSIAAEGGYIAGSAELIDLLRNRARPFIYSTALPPAVIAAASCALRIIESEPERRVHLCRLATRVRSGLEELGCRVMKGNTPIIPVLIGDAETAVRMAGELEREGVFAPAIRPPTVPSGSSRIRLTVMASHTDADVDCLLHAFAAAGRRVGLL